MSCSTRTRRPCSPATRSLSAVETMPPKLAEIVDEFASAPREVVLEMLLEFSDAVHPLPAELSGHEGMEQVPECQTPFFLRADVQPDRTVRTYFDCPPEA